MVAHSYGGIVATEGVQGRFNKATRAQAGQKGGVFRIIYIAAFLVPVGSSLCDPLGGTIPPFIPVDVRKWPYACSKHLGQDFVLHINYFKNFPIICIVSLLMRPCIQEQEMCIMSSPQKMFYHDLPRAEQEQWAGEMLKSPASTQVAPITYAAYKFHPVSYLYCTLDQALRYAVQKRTVGTISERYRISFCTDVLQASHSPFLSMPDKVLAAVERQLGITPR